MVIKKFNPSESAQKFMQVGIDVKCMHTNFGGRSLSSFGDIATFKNGLISPSIVHGQTVKMRENNHKKIIICPPVKPHYCPPGNLNCSYYCNNDIKFSL